MGASSATDVDAAAVVAQLQRQITNFWACEPDEFDGIEGTIERTIERVRECIRPYRQARPFSLLHASHWCIFLQYLRQDIGSGPLFEKLYLLSRALHSVDFYSAVLPDHIYFEHPVGTVIGRAELGDRLVVLQNVTIGGSRDGKGTLHYPVIGDNVILYSASAAIGRVSIGPYSILATGARLLNETVPAGSLVFGTSPHLTIKPLSRERYLALSAFRYT